MSKTALMVVGVIVLAMGVLSVIPSLDWVTEPIWHSIVKIIVGIVAIGIAATDKPVT
jgi:uncharacterized membrane protein HdeD (DUF308 family)